MRALLVEDDRDLSRFVSEGLVREGFAVEAVANGEDAFFAVAQSHFDVIVLDVIVPGPDGFQVLKRLRARGHQGGILIASSRGAENDKLEGLNNGADDYLVKPYLVSELVARIRSVLRRTAAPRVEPKASVLKVGDLRMDLLRREVLRIRQTIHLTKREFDLLECFMRRPGQVLSQTVLLQQLGQSEFASSANLVEVHIKNLRAKIDLKSKTSLITTVRGCGYALKG